jgi:hypothetical protein
MILVVSFAACVFSCQDFLSRSFALAAVVLFCPLAGSEWADGGLL